MRENELWSQSVHIFRKQRTTSESICSGILPRVSLPRPFPSHPIKDRKTAVDVSFLGFLPQKDRKTTLGMSFSRPPPNSRAGSTGSHEKRDQDCRLPENWQWRILRKVSPVRYKKPHKRFLFSNLWGLLSDSNRPPTSQAFAILIKSIIFANQIVAIVSSC